MNILPTWLLKGLSVFLLSTFIASFSNPDAFGFPFIKQFFGAMFSASSYYIVFKAANFNIYYVFKQYCNFAFYASCLALVEEVLHVLGIHIRTAFPGSFGLFRVSGLSGEPYNLSLALFPAAFFYLNNFFSGLKQQHENNKQTLVKSVVILLAFFLTFSSTGYIGLFLAFIFIAFHQGYLDIRKPSIVLAPVFFGLVYMLFAYLSANNENFNTKLQEGAWFLSGEMTSPEEMDNLNSSSFALLSNFQITVEGVKDHPISGVGLGSYEMLFHEKFDQLFGTRFEAKYGRSNFNDANSMFLRLLAETGIIGCSLFLYFIVAFLIKKKISPDLRSFYLISINHGMFILFIIRLIRCGNYLSDGMFFFIFLFYYSYKLFSNQKADYSLAK